MEIKEYGKQNTRCILLVHGGYVSYKTLRVQIEELQKDYHVIVPLLDGHNINETSELNSIEEEAQKILDYFKDRGISQIEGMYGASLGADIILEILFRQGSFAKYAFIESGSLGVSKMFSIPLVYITKMAMYKGVRGSRYWNNFINKFLVDLKMPEDLWEDTKNLIRHMSKHTIENVQKLVCNYHIKEPQTPITTKCLVIYTSKEKSYMEKPYRKLQEQANMEIRILEGYNHGQLCIGEPLKQIKLLKEWMQPFS